MVDAATKKYVERRTAEGKNNKEIRRCLKRFTAGNRSGSSKPS